MPDVSTILSLPLILPAQAQKHVTHNEALRILDVAVQLAVLNRTVSTPPALPAIGDRHIVAAVATGLWAGREGDVAIFGPEGWEFTTPLPGWRAHVLAESVTVVFDGLDWAAPSSGPLAPLLLGVNTTADTTNRLAVSSPATLFTHEGAGHQVKVNKAVAGDTASLLFQSGFSGRAEMGLAGNNDFSIKVSPNGSAFNTGIAIDQTSGVVSMPQGVASDGFSLLDATDPTKVAKFDPSAIGTGVTQTYTLPNMSGVVALLSGTQTFSGNKTFSGGMTVSGSFTASAATATFGTATGAATYGMGAGATLSGATKTVNLGTGGVSGSTTVVNIGSDVAGAGGSVVINAPTVTFGAAVTSVAMTEAELDVKQLALVPLTADPAGLVNGMIWHNTTTGQLRARVDGMSRVIDSPMNVPFLRPIAGDYVMTTTGAGGAAATTLAGAANRLDIYPFTPRADISVDRLTVNVTTLVAAALGKVVIYASDANGRPSVLLIETADLDFSTVGLKLATVAIDLRQGQTYWVGIRHNSTATLSAWALTATPDINGGAAVTTARKVLRRLVTYANAAPITWGFVSSEITAISGTAVWLRVV
ncbi:MAG: DUF2793 domain-containing protein [Paracoccaceae bacterium]